MSDRCIVLCALVDESGPVVQGSLSQECIGCNRRVWVSPSSRRLENPLIYCNECGLAELGDDAFEINFAPGQLEELQAFFDQEAGSQ